MIRVMTDEQSIPHPRSVAFYATPGRHTNVAASGLVGCELVGPGLVGSDVAAIVEQVVRTVQGLVVYDLFAESLYRAELSAHQLRSVHERDAGQLLHLARQVDPLPLTQSRDPGDRIGGRCNTYSLLTVALLRAAGVPARARCGFATYFIAGWYEDHWVAEYWNPAEERWLLIDAQLDDVWRTVLGVDEAVPVHVGPDQFLTAGHAWKAWRQGDLDADRCGLTSLPEHGAFWIANNLRLDFAALNKVEMLPWDLWGLGWEPPDEPTDAVLATFDSIAGLTTNPDECFDELRTRYDSDASLRMDGTVFSAALGEEQRV